MPHFKVNQKDIFFILKDQLNIAAGSRYPNVHAKFVSGQVENPPAAENPVMNMIIPKGEDYGILF